MRLAVVLDCSGLEGLVRFWSQALNYQLLAQEEPYAILGPRSGDGLQLTLQRVPEPKQGKNRMHLDLDVGDFEAESRRLVGLGARQLSAEPFDEGGYHWHLMSDPEGNEFCVISKKAAPGD